MHYMSTLYPTSQEKGSVQSMSSGGWERRYRRLIVTGSREWTDVNAVRWALITASRILNVNNPLVIHGGARGADSISDQIAKDMGWPDPEIHPARWDQLGRAAGHIRNAHMVGCGADFGIAFLIPDLPCKGTRGCTELMHKSLIPVLVVSGKLAE